MNHSPVSEKSHDKKRKLAAAQISQWTFYLVLQHCSSTAMQDQYFGGNYVRKLHFTNVLTGIKVEMRAAGQFRTIHPPCIIDINAGDKGGGGERTLAHSFHINHILFSAGRFHPSAWKFRIFQCHKWIHFHPPVKTMQITFWVLKSPAQVGHEAVGLWDVRGAGVRWGSLLLYCETCCRRCWGWVHKFLIGPCIVLQPGEESGQWCRQIFNYPPLTSPAQPPYESEQTNNTNLSTLGCKRLSVVRHKWLAPVSGDDCWLWTWVATLFVPRARC